MIHHDDSSRFTSHSLECSLWGEDEEDEDEEDGVVI